MNCIQLHYKTINCIFHQKDATIQIQNANGRDPVEDPMESLAHELTMTVLMTPDMASFAGNVHGGTILKYLDSVAYACASRDSGSHVVTLSVGPSDVSSADSCGRTGDLSRVGELHRDEFDGIGNPGHHGEHPEALGSPSQQLLFHDGGG
jgi:hypothetical protein